jgi:hypothetical protein
VLREGLGRTVFGVVPCSELFDQIAFALGLPGRLGFFLVDLVEAPSETPTIAPTSVAQSPQILASAFGLPP